MDTGSLKIMNLLIVLTAQAAVPGYSARSRNMPLLLREAAESGIHPPRWGVSAIAATLALILASKNASNLAFPVFCLVSKHSHKHTIEIKSCPSPQRV